MFVDISTLPGFEISKDGVIRNKKTLAIKSQYISSTGYYMITVSYKNKSKPFRVHRLLAMAFIHNPDPSVFNEVNHIDGNKLNNCLSNLEWTDHIGNMRHAFRIGLVDNKGAKNGMAKLDEFKVLEIKKMLREGISQYKIAKIFKVSRSAILLIHLKKRWSHIE